MNGCFKIFHLDWATDRQQMFETAREKFAGSYDELYTPNFFLDNLDNAGAFLAENAPLLSFDPAGYWDTGYPAIGWTKGEIAIFVANYRAWKMFLETDYDFMILCEDDILVKDYTVKLLEYYVNLLPEDWDVFSYFCPIGQFFKYREEQHKFDDGPLARAYQDHHLLCYLVSKEGARKLVESAENNVIIDPIDWFIFYQSDLMNTYTTKPREEQGVASGDANTTIGHRERFPINNMELDTSKPVVSHWKRWHTKMGKL